MLIYTPRYRENFPGGMPEERWLAEHSIASKVERQQNMRQAHERAFSRFRAQGLPEGEAMLLTNKEMQRLGYYPKSDTITARRLSGAERFAALDAESLIEIADGEMRSGVFPDIEKALADPGTAFDKSMGNYVIHRNYVNSAKLNARIADRATKFLIAYQGELFEVVIERY